MGDGYSPQRIPEFNDFQENMNSEALNIRDAVDLWEERYEAFKNKVIPLFTGVYHQR